MPFFRHAYHLSNLMAVLSELDIRKTKKSPSFAFYAIRESIIYILLSTRSWMESLEICFILYWFDWKNYEFSYHFFYLF